MSPSFSCSWSCNTYMQHIYSIVHHNVLTISSSWWLDSFHTRCQWRILHIRWYDHITNDGVLRQTGLLEASSIVRKRRLGLFGHVARLANDVPANQILQTCCKAQDGAWPSPDWRRARGRPRTSHHMDPPDRPGHWNIGDWCSRAGWGQIVLAANRNGRMLWLITLRHDDDLPPYHHCLHLSND